MQLSVSKRTAATAAAFLTAVLAAFAVAQADPVSLRVIYRCEVAGVVTFSDRACGAESQEYEADAGRVSTYAPPAASQKVVVKTKQKPRGKRAGGSRSSQDSQAKRVADCERIRLALRDIRAKMRSGYGVKEGERLRERQGKLEKRRRAGHCR